MPADSTANNIDNLQQGDVQPSLSIVKDSSHSGLKVLIDQPKIVEKETVQLPRKNSTEKTASERESASKLVAKKSSKPKVVAENESFSMVENSVAVQNLLTHKPETSQKIEQYYLPDWKNEQLLKDLTLSNPKDFTITKTEKSEPEEYKLKLSITETDWLFWFIIGSITVFTWIRVFFGKTISATLSACVNGQITNRLYRESNSLSMKISLVLTLLFSFNLAIFIHQACSTILSLSMPFSGYIMVLIYFAGIVLLYGSKFFLLKTVGFLADISEPMAEYLHIVGIYNKSLGILLYPIIVCIQYLQSDILSRETMIYSGLALILGAFVIRIVRGTVISIRSNFSIFYAILYLCALEIAPNVILYKIAISLL